MAYIEAHTPPRAIGATVDALRVPIEPSAKIWQGAMVCLLANGSAVRAGTPGAGPVVGVAHLNDRERASMQATKGETTLPLATGIFAFRSHATHAPTSADVTTIVYASDDQTISNDANDGPVAGLLAGFDETDGRPMVWIHPLVAGVVAHVARALAAERDQRRRRPRTPRTKTQPTTK